MTVSFLKKIAKRLSFLILLSGLSIISFTSAAGADTISAVSLSGTGTIGSTLTSTLTGTGTPVYAWFDCTSPVAAGTSISGSGCGTAISGATSATYALASADYGFYVTVRVTGTSDGGPYYAASVAVGTQLAPTITASAFPTVNSGAALGITGSVLGTFSAGTTAYASDPTASVTLNGATISYQWYDCSAAVGSGSLALPTTGSSCTAISGATSSSYVLAGSDATFFIMYSETATGIVGAPLVQFSATTTGPVTASAPTNASAPLLSGQTSYSISTSTGSWSGVPNTLSYTYSWYRCTATQTAGLTLPTGCSVISGATTSSYTFAAGDLNKYILSGISASNGVYAAPLVSYSASSAQVTGGLPVLVSTPTITGTNGIGSGNTVSVTNGTWAGFPLPSSYTYTWYSCTGSGTASAVAQSSSSATLPANLGAGQGVCTAISGSSASLALTTQTYIVAEVTATNSNGSFYAYTAGAAVTIAAVPTSTAVTISAAGGVYTATINTWSGQPTPTLSYQWYRCTASSGEAHVATTLAALNALCTAVSGATAVTYSVTAADVTAGYVLVAETATNSSGSLTAYSATSSLSAVIASLTGAAPSITGTPQAGATLTAVKGGWTAVPAPTYSYQWYDCTSQVATASSLPAGCTPISGATSSTYIPTVTEVGLNSSADYVMVSITATNSAGATVRFSGATAVLTSSAPVAASVPTIPATASTSASIAATPGNWLGAPAPILSYQWYSCTSVVASAGSSVPTGCSLISGATSITYLPSSSYVGNYFLVAVTGANGVTIAGATTNVTVYSASTTSPLVSTLSITSLSISGTSSVGSTLTSTTSVTGLSLYTTSYQWYYCTYSVYSGTSIPYFCSAISGATGYSYTISSSYVGYYITVQESVTGSNASATAVANSSSIVTSNVPGTVNYVTATAGVASAVVTWNAPLTGMAPTSYSVTSTPGGLTCTSSSTTCTVTGLSSSTSYTFSVTASNAYGSGLASAASNAVTPTATVPSAPSSVSAVASSGSATITWTASTANGSAITAYTVTSSPSGASCTTTATSCAVASLLNGSTYTFSVVATNAIGSSASSAVSNAVTPRLPVPSAPTGVTVVAVSTKLTVSWTAAVTAGGPVTGYTVTASHGVGLGALSNTCTTTTALSCAITGLTNGIPYNVTVQATNASGISAGSALVSSTPITVPLAPAITSLTALSAGFSIVIKPAVLNTARPITKYQYSLNGGVTWMNLPLTNIISGLKHRLTYSVSLRAMNSIGFSARSVALRVTTK